MPEKGIIESCNVSFGTRPKNLPALSNWAGAFTVSVASPLASYHVKFTKSLTTVSSPTGSSG